MPDALAQLCQGSLGPPLINTTFGAGTNPGNQLAAASTTYQFYSNDCPNDGYYTVRNNTNSCFSNSWHSFVADHTGDPNGYFMLVNASFQPGAFYVDTVRGLCSGTTFEFAAWVMNVMLPTGCTNGGIQPNLTFTIEKTDGTVIQSYTTGDIPVQPVAQWNQYGFYFTTPVGINNVVLRIVNNAPGGCGNDLALDDITFKPCGPLITSSIQGYPVTGLTICENTSVSYDFYCNISAGFANPMFLWQESFNGGTFTDIAGATTTHYIKNFLITASPGVYTFRLAAAEAGNMANVGCRVVSPEITITIEAKPVPVLSTNAPICGNNPLQINASGGAQYAWTGPAGYAGTNQNIVIDNAQPINSGKYYVLMSSPSGCTKADSIAVTVYPVPVANLNYPLLTICEGDTAQLVCSGGTVYEWSPSVGLSATNTGNPLAYPKVSVNYQVIVSNDFNCKDTVNSDFTVLKRIVAKAGPDKVTVAGVPVMLDGSVSGDSISFSWNPEYLDNPSIENPLASPPAGIHEYRLTVTSNAGCGTVTDAMKVTVYKEVFVPTGFTPNNDGKNDKWIIPGLVAYPGFELNVYDRSGQLMFQTSNSQQGWDGRYKGEQLPAGMYVYVLQLNNGPSSGLQKGTVMLIR
ncbi:MAG: gliding motility-associated C-terminal domain-containing protein [Chitinophagaceae bacterium]|nr:gliding motility-associated C-terminal domain-containing protein [Chitinophagaceae bacterium]